MKKLIKSIIVSVLIFISSNVLGATYSTTTGSFNGAFYPGTDQESHSIIVPNASTLKVTVNLILEACYIPERYSDLTCVLYENFSSSSESINISTGSPDYSGYESITHVFYAPNNISLDFYFSTNWCYNGYFNVSYEAYSATTSNSLWTDWLIDADANYWYLGRKKVGDYNFLDKSNPLLVVHKDGNVGINTLTPATTFHVKGTTKLEGDVYNTGTLKTNEVVVEVDDETWPDYVFKKDYILPSLEYVQAYISKKGHLPLIPSANDVSEDGVNLGEISKLLLQKVEELTLYIIDQNKRIQDLESRVE